MRHFAFLSFIILFSYPVAADVLSQFLLPGRQCITAASTSENGNISVSILDQDATSVMLVNPDLTLRFSRRFSSAGTISPSDIVSTTDGGSIVAGTISLPAGNTDAIVFKVGATGNIVWKKIFGTADNDELHSMTILQDGSVAVLGHRISSATSHDLLIAHLSKGGAILWQKVLGTPALDHAGAITSTLEPALIISAGSGTAPIRPIWIKLSVNGAILNARAGSLQEYIATFYIENPQGGYYLGSVGPLVQGQLSKTNISRFDANDHLLWGKSFGLSGTSLTLPRGIVNSDGSVVLAGNAFTPNSLKGILMKISSSGGLQWKRALNLPQSLFFGAIQQSDGNIFAAGCVNLNTDSEDALVLSLPISGNAGGCSRLTSAAISAAAAPMTLSNFSIAVLDASFRTQSAAIQSTTSQTSKSAVCP